MLRNNTSTDTQTIELQATNVVPQTSDNASRTSDSPKFAIDEFLRDKYDSIISVYLKEIGKFETDEPTLTQYQLNQIFVELRDCYNMINNSIRKYMPTTYTPQHIVNDLEKYDRAYKQYEKNKKNIQNKFEYDTEQMRRSFRAALKKANKKKFIKETFPKPPVVLLPPQKVISLVETTTQFRKNYMRRARIRNNIGIMPPQFIIPALTGEQKRKNNKKASRKRAWARKNPGAPPIANAVALETKTVCV